MARLPLPILIRADGTQGVVMPSNGRKFSLRELQTFVGGLIEFIDIPDGRVLIMNEEGRFNGSAPNPIASQLVPADLTGGTVFGDVVSVPEQYLHTASASRSDSPNGCDVLQPGFSGHIIFDGNTVSGVIGNVGESPSPGATPFKVTEITTPRGGDGNVPWAVVRIDNRFTLRVNPSISPFRLFDCITMVQHHRKRLDSLETGAGFKAGFGANGSENFYFWKMKHRKTLQTIYFADTVERYNSHNNGISEV